jgi:hypothetical protein
VFVRDKKKNKLDKHPHIQSIIIHSFSYQIGDEPPTVLVSDYEQNRDDLERSGFCAGHSSPTHEPAILLKCDP